MMVLSVTAGMGFGPPATPPASTATVVVLGLMHLVSFTISEPPYIRLVLGVRR